MAELLKVHGSMNQFFILDQDELTSPLNDEQLTALAIQLCDENHHILGGADGLLVVDHGTHKGVRGRMQVVNADGSRASMCGNGLRTVSRYLSDKYGEDEFVVQTAKVDLRVRRQPELAPGVPAFAVEISPVSFTAESLPFTNLGHQRLLATAVPELAPRLHFTALSIPNPHLISFVSEEVQNGSTLGQLGTFLNGANPYFPEGVNVNFAHIDGDSQLFVRTFERGVGFTNACGTGMSATSLALVLTHPDVGHFDTPIKVFNPGGMVKTIVHHDHHRYWVELIGNATVTAHVTVDEKLLKSARFTAKDVRIEPTNEQDSYDHFVETVAAQRQK
ncbi:diaminopimelate epimerase [uncultured Limosilactobacillus sp.]|uniref:diaminopimelate epimerase n=1 Tax=uncultured Limosilactobacillus sp. TaxID=2837629 RepID=UPI0025D0F686|nr:diaminopimelate epimerase [uncultured Limosilactobacillus sp.]